MKKIISVITFFITLFALSSISIGADYKPAIIFDMGGKFDKSYNQAGFEGAERFRKETGIEFREFEVTAPAQREQAARKMAQRGSQVVIAMGFDQAAAIEKAAKEFPNTKFVIIDMVVDLPNVRSVVFREHEGSFLVGMAAAMKSKTGKVGFVGGMDIPLIRNFGAGYEEGAKYVNSNIQVFHNMTGTTPAAWNNPGKGSELAKSQFGRGADVVYAAAGGTGIGVYQAAADENKFAIGVDSNQNYIQPGTMLTSMVKRVDTAVYLAMKDVKNGTFTSGFQSLGLAEEGVGWALDKFNRPLVTSDMEKKIEQARQDIISGKIVVKGYKAN